MHVTCSRSHCFYEAGYKFNHDAELEARVFPLPWAFQTPKEQRELCEGLSHSRVPLPRPRVLPIPDKETCSYLSTVVEICGEAKSLKKKSLKGKGFQEQL